MKTKREEIEDRILASGRLAAADGVTFSELLGLTGMHHDFRALDRALQAMRRRGLIVYRKKAWKYSDPA